MANTMNDDLLDNYNPLYDIHLRQYFALPHMQRHLRRLGLVDDTGQEGGDSGDEDAMYARQHAMVDRMLRNREVELQKYADLQRKLYAAEKIEICRRIRSGATSPSPWHRAKPSRSLSRGRHVKSHRRRRSSTSTDEKDLIRKIEAENEEPAYENTSLLDDETLATYMEQLRRQLSRLERFREVSFGPYSVARHQNDPHVSWFFRRRSLPSLTDTTPITTTTTTATTTTTTNIEQPALRSVRSLKQHRSRSDKSQSPGKSGVELIPKRRRDNNDSDGRLPPITRNIKSGPTPLSTNTNITKLPPAERSVPAAAAKKVFQKSGAPATAATTTTPSGRKPVRVVQKARPKTEGSTALPELAVVGVPAPLTGPRIPIKPKKAVESKNEAAIEASRIIDKDQEVYQSSGTMSPENIDMGPEKEEINSPLRDTSTDVEMRSESDLSGKTLEEPPNEDMKNQKQPEDQNITPHEIIERTEIKALNESTVPELEAAVEPTGQQEPVESFADHQTVAVDSAVVETAYPHLPVPEMSIHPPSDRSSDEESESLKNKAETEGTSEGQAVSGAIDEPEPVKSGERVSVAEPKDAGEAATVIDLRESESEIISAPENVATLEAIESAAPEVDVEAPEIIAATGMPQVPAADEFAAAQSEAIKQEVAEAYRSDRNVDGYNANENNSPQQVLQHTEPVSSPETHLIGECPEGIPNVSIPTATTEIQEQVPASVAEPLAEHTKRSSYEVISGEAVDSIKKETKTPPAESEGFMEGSRPGQSTQVDAATKDFPEASQAIPSTESEPSGTEEKAAEIKGSEASETEEKAEEIKRPETSETEGKAVEIKGLEASETEEKAVEIKGLEASETEEKAVEIKTPVTSETEGKDVEIKGLEASETEEKAVEIKGPETSETEGKAVEIKGPEASETEGKAVEIKGQEASETEGKAVEIKGPEAPETEGKAVEIKGLEASETEEKAVEIKTPVTSETEGKDVEIKGLEASETEEKAAEIKRPETETEGKAVEIKGPEASETEGKAVEIKGLEASETEGKAVEIKGPEASETEGKAVEIKGLEASETEEKAVEIKGPEASEGEEKAVEIKTMETSETEGKDVEIKTPETSETEGKDVEIKGPEASEGEEKAVEIKRPEVSEDLEQLKEPVESVPEALHTNEGLVESPNDENETEKAAELLSAFAAGEPKTLPEPLLTSPLQSEELANQVESDSVAQKQDASSLIGFDADVDNVHLLASLQPEMKKEPEQPISEPRIGEVTGTAPLDESGNVGPAEKAEDTGFGGTAVMTEKIERKVGSPEPSVSPQEFLMPQTRSEESVQNQEALLVDKHPEVEKMAEGAEIKEQKGAPENVVSEANLQTGPDSDLIQQSVPVVSEGGEELKNQETKNASVKDVADETQLATTAESAERQPEANAHLPEFGAKPKVDSELKTTDTTSDVNSREIPLPDYSSAKTDGEPADITVKREGMNEEPEIQSLATGYEVPQSNEDAFQKETEKAAAVLPVDIRVPESAQQFTEPIQSPEQLEQVAPKTKQISDLTAAGAGLPETSKTEPENGIPELPTGNLESVISGAEKLEQLVPLVPAEEQKWESGGKVSAALPTYSAAQIPVKDHPDAIPEHFGTEILKGNLESVIAGAEQLSQSKSPVTGDLHRSAEESGSLDAEKISPSQAWESASPEDREAQKFHENPADEELVTRENLMKADSAPPEIIEDSPALAVFEAAAVKKPEVAVVEERSEEPQEGVPPEAGNEEIGADGFKRSSESESGLLPENLTMHTRGTSEETVISGVSEYGEVIQEIMVFNEEATIPDVTKLTGPAPGHAEFGDKSDEETSTEQKKPSPQEKEGARHTETSKSEEQPEVSGLKEHSKVPESKEEQITTYASFDAGEVTEHAAEQIGEKANEFLEQFLHEIVKNVVQQAGETLDSHEMSGRSDGSPTMCLPENDTPPVIVLPSSQSPEISAATNSSGTSEALVENFPSKSEHVDNGAEVPTPLTGNGQQLAETLPKDLESIQEVAGEQDRPHQLSNQRTAQNLGDPKPVTVSEQELERSAANGEPTGKTDLEEQQQKTGTLNSDVASDSETLPASDGRPSNGVPVETPKHLWVVYGLTADGLSVLGSINDSGTLSESKLTARFTRSGNGVAKVLFNNITASTSDSNGNPERKDVKKQTDAPPDDNSRPEVGGPDENANVSTPPDTGNMKTVKHEHLEMDQQHDDPVNEHRMLEQNNSNNGL